MYPWLKAPALEGSLVRLEPLAVRHAGDLAAAAEEDRGSYGHTWCRAAARSAAIWTRSSREPRTGSSRSRRSGGQTAARWVYGVLGSSFVA